jgi:hypothetical protein
MKGVVCVYSILAWANTVVFATQPLTLQTPDFSAEIVTHDASGAVVAGAGRLYVSRGKVRIDPPSSATDYFLVDTQSTNALFVRPVQHIYMDARQSTRLTQLFLPSDPNRPCELWQIAARHAGTQSVQDKWNCERVSAGRNVGYIVGSTPENSTQRWIDPELSFPVKVRTADGTTLELQHIKKEPQPPDLFLVPSGYQKTAPRAPNRRMKTRSLWVTPGN